MDLARFRGRRNKPEYGEEVFWHLVTSSLRGKAHRMPERGGSALPTRFRTKAAIVPTQDGRHSDRRLKTAACRSDSVAAFEPNTQAWGSHDTATGRPRCQWSNTLTLLVVLLTGRAGIVVHSVTRIAIC